MTLSSAWLSLTDSVLSKLMETLVAIRDNGYKWYDQEPSKVAHYENHINETRQVVMWSW